MNTQRFRAPRTGPSVGMEDDIYQGMRPCISKIDQEKYAQRGGGSSGGGRGRGGGNSGGGGRPPPPNADVPGSNIKPPTERPPPNTKPPTTKPRPPQGGEVERIPGAE